MKKLLALLTWVMVLASCGIPKNKVDGESREFTTTDPAFASYISKFETKGAQYTGDSGFRIGDIPINFRDPDSPAHKGVCRTYFDGTREIFIRKSWWDNVSDAFRESLLFHELGHCRLEREHDNSLYDHGGRSYKISMMNSHIVSEKDFLDLEESYLKELFAQDSSPLLLSIDAL